MTVGEHSIRVDLGSHEVVTTTVGAPSAPALLLLHGVGSSRRFLVDAFGGPVVAAGWRLVAADVRGHGDATPWPDPADHALEHLASDVRALARWSGAAVVGGVSLGGHAAVEAVVDGLDVAAVVACLPAWTDQAPAGVGPHAAVAERVRAVGLDGMLESFRDDRAMVPWLRDVLVRDWPRSDPASLAAALAALDGGRAPSAADIARLDVPLGIVAWPDDPGHPWEVATTWADLAPRARLERITLMAAEDDLAAFGVAAVRTLDELGVSPESVA